MRESLAELINGRYIEDIYLAGFFADDESPKRFVPDLSYVYIKIGSSYIELEHDEHDYKIHVRIVNGFRPNYEDEDYSNCISSIKSQVLVSPVRKNRISTMLFYGMEDTGEKLTCDALELIIERQTVFFDPQFLHDITIGGEMQKQCWKENFEMFILPRVEEFPNITSIDFE